MCYPLEHYFQKTDNLAELYLKISESIKKNSIAPSLGQRGPQPLPVVFAYMNEQLPEIKMIYIYAVLVIYQTIMVVKIKIGVNISYIPCNPYII